jgi:hypothetical protein
MKRIEKRMAERGGFYEGLRFAICYAVSLKNVPLRPVATPS